MMPNTTKNLGDVLYDFALAMPVPDAGILDEFARRYPEYAEVLTDFAVQIAFDSSVEESEEDEGSAEESVSPAVSRAISHFQNVAFELENSAAGSMEFADNPFAALSRDDFHAFAARISANPVFVMKLRDRQIEPETIVSRTGFCRAAADALDISVSAMNAHLSAQPGMVARQQFKADEKPSMPNRETFEEAVRSSGLTPEQQRRLLEM